MKIVRPVILAAAVLLTSQACAGRINDGLWQSFSNRSYSTAIGTAIHESSWMFAIIESFHLLGLAVIGGTILLVDLRLLGLGLREESAAALWRASRRTFVAALVVMLISGALLYLSEATKFYSEGFWDSAEFPFIYKMAFLALAIAFTFTVRRWVLEDGASDARPYQQKLVALTSMLLWLGVGVGGRGIGFY
jgi:hypothetical protein